MVAVTRRFLQQSGVRVGQSGRSPAFTPGGLPGVGPWAIEAGCPARAHNTLNAARGRKGNTPCTCPRARALREERRLYDREHATRYKAIRNTRGGIRRETNPRVSPQSADPVKANYIMNFESGLCTTTEYGREIARAGMTDQKSLGGIAARQLAKEQCDRCPLKPGCKVWIEGQESPPGSWGGVWGGLDAWDRKGVKLVIEDGKAKVIKREH